LAAIGNVLLLCHLPMAKYRRVAEFCLVHRGSCVGQAASSVMPNADVGHASGFLVKQQPSLGQGCLRQGGQDSGLVAWDGFSRAVAFFLPRDGWAGEAKEG